MLRLTLLLILALLASHILAGGGVLRFAGDLLATDSGWEMDPNGSPTSSDPSSDRGWEIDPNG